MGSRKYMPAIIRKIIRLNPDVELVYGTKHWRVEKNGKLICILPRTFSQEGLNNTTKSIFKREDIKWQLYLSVLDNIIS